MMRNLISSLMAVPLVLAGLSLADARGTGGGPGTGMEIVICSGVQMTTITIGPDGQPVEQVAPCPDGTSIFAAAFAVPEMPMPPARLIAFVAAVPTIAPADQEALSPSARGPPALA